MTHRLPPKFFPGRTQGREKGFSLLEALIVVSIGMIMTAFAIPMVQSAVRSYTLNSVATNMTRMIQLARYAAINNGGYACTVFASNQFGLGNASSGNPNCTALGTGTGTSAVRMTIPSGVSLGSASPPSLTSMGFPSTPDPVSCSGYAITFNSRGSKSFVCSTTATGSAVTNIIYITGWGDTRAVTVTGTGRARSWSWNGTTWR